VVGIAGLRLRGVSPASLDDGAHQPHPGVLGFGSGQEGGKRVLVAIRLETRDELVDVHGHTASRTGGPKL